MAMLEVDGLTVSFRRSDGSMLKAVDDVSFAVDPGTTLALVGESGSGKSTIARLIMGLITPDAGTVRLDGAPVNRRRGQISPEIQMVFQEPYEALNPRMRISDLVAEPLVIRKKKLTKKQRVDVVIDLLHQVGLQESHAFRFPWMMSGGQLQRVCIARALASAPRVLVLDEPTASLDLPVRAEVLNVLSAFQREHGLSYVFITHDLATVRYLADSVAVMYKGQVREYGSYQAVFEDGPTDPYTATLLAAELSPVPGTP